MHVGAGPVVSAFEPWTPVTVRLTPVDDEEAEAAAAAEGAAQTPAALAADASALLDLSQVSGGAVVCVGEDDDDCTCTRASSLFAVGSSPAPASPIAAVPAG